jgi:hypothetical protein
LNAAAYLDLPIELNAGENTQASPWEIESNSEERVLPSASKALTLHLASGGSV